MTSNRTGVIFLIIVLLLSAVAYLYFDYTRDEVNPETPNSMEVESENENTPEEEGFGEANTTEYSLRYPESTGLTYVDLEAWPPEVALSDESFVCTEGGDEGSDTGSTESVTISGDEYCRTTTVEGAAGSVYAEYSYSFPVDSGTATLTFSTRSPQCDNFDGPPRTQCEEDQTSFNPDDLVSQISLTLTPVIEM